MHVPVFTGDNELSSGAVEYDLVAAIMHHGDSVLAGHYTVHLTEAAGDTICDDNDEPVFHARDSVDGTRESRNVYMLICKRRREVHPVGGAAPLI